MKKEIINLATAPMGKIGFFDSGLGGLTIFRSVINQLPNYSYIYLGDNLNAPYGAKTEQEIFQHTLAGVEWLYVQGAELVVLACNTASALALRKIQQEILPIKYPDKKVLGIIIPTAEEAENFSQTKHIGILATSATVNSGVFEKEIQKRCPRAIATSQSGGRLVEMIENDADNREIEIEASRSVGELLKKDSMIDVIILGCTHYALVAQEIKKAVPVGVIIIDEAPLVTDKFQKYLLAHPEVTARIVTAHNPLSH